jgi:hypothetical protein
MSPRDLESVIGELAESAREARASDAVNAEIRGRLTAIGSDVVPLVIRHLRGIAWHDENDDDLDAWETEAFMSALAQIDDDEGKRFVIESGRRLTDVSDEPTYSERMLGCDAFRAMACSDDPHLHDVLAEWVVAIETSGGGWNFWWLIDQAVPFLDDRARPVLVRLLDYGDGDSDVAKAARRALGALDRRATT